MKTPTNKISPFVKWVGGKGGIMKELLKKKTNNKITKAEIKEVKKWLVGEQGFSKERKLSDNWKQRFAWKE